MFPMFNVRFPPEADIPERDLLNIGRWVRSTAVLTARHQSPHCLLKGRVMRKLLLLGAIILGNDTALAADTVITNVSVVDVETGKVRSGQTVVISGNRIRSVGSKPSAKADAVAIDGSGKFMLPGFWDMGSFAFNGTRGVPAAMELMVAHGVVGTRDLGTAGTPAQIKGLIGQIESGKKVGPKVIWTTKALTLHVWPQRGQGRSELS